MSLSRDLKTGRWDVRTPTDTLCSAHRTAWFSVAPCFSLREGGNARLTGQAGKTFGTLQKQMLNPCLHVARSKALSCFVYRRN